MRKGLLLFFLFIFSFVFSQQDQETDKLENVVEYQESIITEESGYYGYEEFNISNDTITYNKTVEYSKERVFDSSFKNEYSGHEFTYIDDLKEEKKKEEKPKERNTQNASNFISFMSNFFPYLIGIIVVFIIFKTFVNTESGFWKFGKSKKITSEKLVYDDDDDTIDDSNFNSLLDKAIKDENYRLATRYYYLFSLKELSKKELIKYDKDKTNTEYQFELENKELRKKFSYLSYIYDYVWYGEFPIDKLKFNVIETKYKSFMNII